MMVTQENKWNTRALAILFVFSILFASSVFALPVPFEFTVNPPEPTEDDSISISIAGDWPNSCVPENPVVSVNNGQIQIDTSNPGEFCLFVVTPWEITANIGKLSAGEYR